MLMMKSTARGWPGLLCNPGVQEAVRGKCIMCFGLFSTRIAKQTGPHMGDPSHDVHHAITANQFLHPIRGACYEGTYYQGCTVSRCSPGYGPTRLRR